jgi:hypothetical protein
LFAGFISMICTSAFVESIVTASTPEPYTTRAHLPSIHPTPQNHSDQAGSPGPRAHTTIVSRSHGPAGMEFRGIWRLLGGFYLLGNIGIWCLE